MNELKDSQRKFGNASKLLRLGNQNSLKTRHPRLKYSDQNLNSNSISTPQIKYKLGAYIRLSPSDEIRDEGSLVSHPQRIKSFVDFKNQQQSQWGEIVEWYTDKDMSGKDMNRPAFIRMLQDIKNGKINAVVANELSRLSRDVKDFCQFWEFLKKHNATFFSLKESFDTSTPIGELMVIQCISFAQFERKTIVQRIKDGARARAERGLANGNQRILGYDPDPNKTCHLIINSQEAVTVQHIFEKFLELGSIRKLRDHLNSNGFRTKKYTSKGGKDRGGKIWTPSTLHSILTNLSYIGKREVNKKNRILSQEQLQDSDRYKMVNATWKAIVSEELFYNVQDLLITNAVSKRGEKHTYRLTGLIFCGECNEVMSGKKANGRNGEYFYYSHNRKFTSRGDQNNRCTIERIPAPQLEEIVISRLFKLAENKNILEELDNLSKNNQGYNHERTETLISGKEQDKRNVQLYIDNLLSVLVQNPAGSKSVVEKISQYELQKEQIQLSIELLKNELSSKNKKVNVEQVFKVFQVFKQGFKDLPVHKQRDVIGELLHKAVIEKSGIRFIYYGSPNEELFNPDTTENLLSSNLKSTYSDSGSPIVRIGGGGGSFTPVPDL